jgi:hypothetical protein
MGLVSAGLLVVCAAGRSDVALLCCLPWGPGSQREHAPPLIPDICFAITQTHLAHIHASRQAVRVVWSKEGLCAALQHCVLCFRLRRLAGTPSPHAPPRLANGHPTRFLPTNYLEFLSVVLLYFAVAMCCPVLGGRLVPPPSPAAVSPVGSLLVTISLVLYVLSYASYQEMLVAQAAKAAQDAQEAAAAASAFDDAEAANAQVPAAPSVFDEFEGEFGAPAVHAPKVAPAPAAVGGARGNAKTKLASMGADDLFEDEEEPAPASHVAGGRGAAEAGGVLPAIHHDVPEADAALLKEANGPVVGCRFGWSACRKGVGGGG